MIEFILAILSFISSFIPYFGYIIAIIIAIVAIILSKVKLKRKNENIKGEIYIISIVVSIVAIILSIIIGVFTFINYNENTNNNSMFSNSVIANYNSYNIGNDINVNNQVQIKINSINKENNKYVANITFKALAESVNISTYDFFIYDEENNKTYFPAYNDDFISLKISKDESITQNISFDISDEINKAFLVYRYDLYGVKVKI